MQRLLDGWNWKRILFLLILPNAAFALAAMFTQAPFLIVVENVVLIGVSAAICIAFLPEVVDGFRAGRPLTGEFTISLGIVGSWFDWLARALFSLVWRGVPNFKWIVDSDLNSAILFWTLCAALCHLQAPQVIDGRVPGRKWMRVGIIAGVCIVVAILAFYHRPIASYMRAAWNGQDPAMGQYVATTSDRDVISVLKSLDEARGAEDKGPYTFRLTASISQGMADKIEEWRSEQTPIPSKSAAIRHLLGEAIDAEDKAHQR